jgi:ATP-dependent Clp protease ATP-binding subunit ClpX
MYDLPSLKGVSKVVVDNGLINGEGKPLLIYSEQGDQSLAAGA